MEQCEAGRTAFFGGRWAIPCIHPGRNVIGTELGVSARLCDTHFAEVEAAGLIDHPRMDPTEFDRLTGGKEIDPALKRHMIYGEFG